MRIFAKSVDFGSMARLSLLSGLILLAGLAGTGCSSLNPFASSTTVRNTPAPLIDFKPNLALRSVWSTTIGKAGNYSFSPVLVEDSLFVAAADGSIARLNAKNGQLLWRINADTALTAGVGSDGNVVAVAGEKGSVLVFDDAGKLRWKKQASSEVLSAPVVGGGLVIVRSVDNRITAFDVSSGARRWSVQRATPSLSLRSAPGLVIAGSNVIVALPAGKLLAVALANGAVRWEASVSNPRGATELERIADVSGLPLVLGRSVCAITYQGRLACFDVSNGALRWAKDLSSDVGLDGDERFVFAADERGTVHALARDTGLSAWSNDKLQNRHLSAPISFGRAVVVGDGQGFIHFLSREDGSFIGRIAIDGSPVIGTPLVAGANLIFQTQSGTVVALASE